MEYDVVVIGGGVCGLSASLEIRRLNKRVLLLEKEKYVGGVTANCVHDGFGLIKYRENLTGPEYVEKLVDACERLGVVIRTEAFVRSLDKTSQFIVKYVDCSGMHNVKANAVILATGADERTSRQVFLHGSRPAGVFTVGEIQYYINILGKMPVKKCVILGGGDSGMAIARRLHIEGAEIEGIYEKSSVPTCLENNLTRSVIDLDIPLHLNSTVTKIIGEGRVEGVEVATIKNGVIDEESKHIVECDSLVVAVGLIPHIRLLDKFSLALDDKTGSVVVNQAFMTTLNGLFVCGNALNNNDYADYASELGEITGRNAALYSHQDRNEIKVKAGQGVEYVVPQRIDITKPHNTVICYFKPVGHGKSFTLKAIHRGRPLTVKRYTDAPSGTLRVKLDFSTIEDDVTFEITEDKYEN